MSLKTDTALLKDLEELKNQIETWKENRKKKYLEEVAFLKQMKVSMQKLTSSSKDEVTQNAITTLNSLLAYSIPVEEKT